MKRVIKFVGKVANIVQKCYVKLLLKQGFQQANSFLQEIIDMEERNLNDARNLKRFIAENTTEKGGALR